MAAPTFGAAGAGAEADAGTLAIPYPAGISAGHALFFTVNRRQTTGADLTTPAGWDIVDGPVDAPAGANNEIREWVCGTIADGTESGSLTVTVSGTSTNSLIGRMVRVVGSAAYTGSILDYVEGIDNAVGNASPVGMPSVVTAGTDRLAICFSHIGNDSAVAAATGETGGDWVEAVAEYLPVAGMDGTIQVQTADMASGGTISGGTFSYIGAAVSWASIAFALRQPGAPPRKFILTRP